MIRSLTLSLLLLASAAHAQALTHMRVDSAGAGAIGTRLLSEGYDVLEGSHAENGFEIILSDEEIETLTLQGIELELIAVGRPFNEIQSELDVPVGYLDLQGVLDSMMQTAANFPNIAQVVDLTAKYGLPTTVEGRHIYAMKISDNVTLEEDEPTALLVSAHHCREIVTPVIALRGIDRLTTQYGIDSDVTNTVDNNEVWIVPVWNVDGYNEVFVGNNLWRKNRRVFPGGTGVDLNRNYPFGWTSGCSGSTVVTSQTYKGPSAASEVETQTMIAFGSDRRFSRVVDLHSFGREVLYGYLCAMHPLTNYWLNQATSLSIGAGYAGSIRPPTAEGEHYQWQIARGALSFLIETHQSFQPTFASAEAEAAQVWPGIQTLFNAPIPLTGNVHDLCTNDPVPSSLSISTVVQPNGERIGAGGPFARFDYFLPDGNTDLSLSNGGFTTTVVNTTITNGSTTDEQVVLAANAQLANSGTMQIGTTVQFDFDSLSDKGRTYACVMSATGTSPGIPINNCSLPINLDSTTLLPLNSPAVFNNFLGTLDASGQATSTFDIPNSVDIIGIDLDFAYFTIDMVSGLAIHVSNAAHVQIQP
ncbi:MAG: putative deacylase [Planctomycetota bacterium]|jgi:predicted deacylase